MESDENQSQANATSRLSADDVIDEHFHDEDSDLAEDDAEGIFYHFHRP